MSTRHTLPAGLAGILAASAAPAAATAVDTPDPVFAAIEKHKATEEAFTAARRIAEEGPEAEATMNAFNDALYALVDTVPTTLAGLAVFAEYIDCLVEGGDWQCAGWAMTAIGKACRAMIGESAA